MHKSQISCRCCPKSSPRVPDSSQLNHRTVVLKVSTYLWPKRCNIAVLISIPHHRIQILNADFEFCEVPARYTVTFVGNFIRSTYRSMLLEPVDLSMVMGYQILICCSSHSQYLCYEISLAAVASRNNYPSACYAKRLPYGRLVHLRFVEYKYNLTPILEWLPLR